MRHMQKSEGMTQGQVIKAVQDGHEFSNYKKDFKDVEVIGLSSLTVEMVIGMIDWYLEEKGEIGAIAFDYLSLFKGCANNTEATAKVATELKTRVAKAANCVVLCLVQASRKYEGDGGNVEITKHAGKDSGYIEDSADYLIGSWNHEGKNYARFLKSRAFNNEFGDNPYLELELNKPHMNLVDIKELETVPKFNQLKEM